MAYQTRITEVEENAVRNLLSRMRQEEPARFIDLVIQSLLAPINDNSIVAIGNASRKSEDESAAVVVIFKGDGPAKLAIDSLAQLQARLKELESEQGSKGGEG